MANPSKPSRVKVDDLKTVLEQLKRLQGDLQQPRPGTWDSIGNTIENDLRSGDNGMQENVAEQAGQRYADAVYWINQGWTSIKGGVDTLVGLLQTTIDQHSKADHGTATNAASVNTSQQPATATQPN